MAVALSLCRYVDDIECYCEETNTWETVGKIPPPDSGFGLTYVSLRVRNDALRPEQKAIGLSR